MNSENILVVLKMSNTIHHSWLNITGLFHSHSILHYKVPGDGVLNQALLEGCILRPGLLTVDAAVVLAKAFSIHPTVVAASVSRATK